jgi:hypothetical protein
LEKIKSRWCSPQAFFLILIFFLFVYGIVICCQTEISYHATISLLSSALSLVDGHYLFYVDQTPLPALLYLPVALFYKIVTPYTLIKIAGIYSVAISMLYLGLVYCLLKRHFTEMTAGIFAFLLLLNPLFIHYFHFPMTDILLSAVIIIYFLILTEKGVDHWGISLCLWAAAAIKTPMIILFPFTWALAIGQLLELKKSGHKNIPFGRIFLRLVAIPLLGIALSYLVVLGWAWTLNYLIHQNNYTSWWELIKTNFHIFQSSNAAPLQSERPDVVAMPSTAYFKNLSNLLSYPLLLLATGGILRTFIHREKKPALILAWGLFYFLFLSLLIPVKEMRYLFPMIFVFYYLAAEGLKGLSELVKRIPRSSVSIILPALLIMVLATIFHSRPFWWNHFSSIYTTPFWRTFITDLQLSKRPLIYVTGTNNPLLNQLSFFFPDDLYFGIFHFGKRDLNYFMPAQEFRRVPDTGGPEEKRIFAQNNDLLVNFYPHLTGHQNIQQNLQSQILSYLTFSWHQYPITSKTGANHWAIYNRRGKLLGYVKGLDDRGNIYLARHKNGWTPVKILSLYIDKGQRRIDLDVEDPTLAPRSMAVATSHLHLFMPPNDFFTDQGKLEIIKDENALWRK